MLFFRLIYQGSVLCVNTHRSEAVILLFMFGHMGLLEEGLMGIRPFSTQTSL